MADHLEVGGADRGRVDADQHFRDTRGWAPACRPGSVGRDRRAPTLSSFSCILPALYHPFSRHRKDIGSGSVLNCVGLYIIFRFDHMVYQKEALMKFGRLVRLTVALLALPLLAYAQDATLSGTVKDNTGGVLPGVTVTATNEASGITFVERHRRTRDCIGSRFARASTRSPRSLRGSPPRRGPASSCCSARRSRLNFNMQVSSLQETVTVTGEAPLLDTTTSTIASNIDPRQMQELPDQRPQLDGPDDAGGRVAHATRRARCRRIGRASSRPTSTASRSR